MKTWIAPPLALALALTASVLLAPPPASAANEKAAPKPATQPAKPAAEASPPAPAAKQPAETDPIEEFIQKTKKPVPWFEWGADARLRDEYIPNGITLNKNVPNHDIHFQRYRERVWGTITPVDGFEVNFRLTYEPRHYCEPNENDRVHHVFSSVSPGAKPDWVLDEAIVDNLNIKWKNPFGLPVTATVGRQDIFLSDGWLVGDGTPVDGSRTSFFDAARLTWDLKEAQTTIDTIYIDQHTQSERWLEPFCDKDFDNMEQNERGAILYVTNKSVKDLEVNGYFIYKNDRKVTSAGNNSDIYTFGGRAAYAFNKNWEARSELASQFGDKNGNSLCSLGSNNRITYLTRDPWSTSFRGTYEFLSGDNPNTKTNEAFDPLWGRWPQWSELWIYTVLPETGGRPGETTNLHRLGPGATFKPMPKLELKADYYLLFANKNTFQGTAAANHGLSTGGNFRGQMITTKATYTFNKHISTYVLGEVFFPGDYYSDLRNDVAAFLRYELCFTW